MQNSWGQGSTQTSPPSGLIQSCSSDGEFTAPACAPFNTLLPAPAPASSNAADHRRPTAKAPHPNELLKCPRCDSLETKFCYFNNYSLTQPRYFCKSCKRYWTAGGALRNVPVGGGLRKNKRSKLKLAAAAAAAADAEAASAGIIARSSVAAEASQVLDISDVTPVLFAHPSGEKPSMKFQVADNRSLASHCIAEHTTHQLNGAHAPAAILPPQAGNFFTKEEANAGTAFYCDPNQTSPYFPSFAASMSMPFHSAAVPSGSAPGFVVNYNIFTSQTGRDAGASSSDVGVTGGIGASAIGSSAGDIKQEKDATQVPVSNYDWQLLSEGLFNGTGSTDSNFLYTPSSSWPDFSQFNDAGHG